ncbi:MAG: hypothetical protein IKI50_01960 [Clostridia bacterium]|nr:hypothetical protein [Clostridia bacterium]
MPTVIDFIRYRAVGETIREDYLGTLQQHFGRFTLIGDSEASVVDTVRRIQALLVITDTEGNRMNRTLFDPARLRKMSP